MTKLQIAHGGVPRLLNSENCSSWRAGEYQRGYESTYLQAPLLSEAGATSFGGDGDIGCICMTVTASSAARAWRLTAGSRYRVSTPPSTMQNQCLLSVRVPKPWFPAPEIIAHAVLWPK